MNLKDQVLWCLEHYPETRNSDVKLTNAIWVSFFSHKVKNIDGEWHVKLLDLYELPREDNIKRLRAKIQNEEGLFPPTDPKVMRQRKIKEEEWRSDLGYNPELRTA